MEIRKYTLESNRLYAERFVPENKQFKNTLVFVHGSFGGYWVWDSIISRLVKYGYECVTFSLRGHKPSGNFDLTDLHMSDYVDDVKDVLVELNIDEPVLIGHSMGGLVALMTAMAVPTCAVISISPSQSFEVQGSEDEYYVSKIPLVYNLDDFGINFSLSDDHAIFSDISEETLIKMNDMFGQESGSARQDRKSGISIPINSIHSEILFIGAELGDSLPFGISLEKTKAMADYYDSDLIEIKGATHFGIILGEHSPEVAMRINEWLQSIKR